MPPRRRGGRKPQQQQQQQQQQNGNQNGRQNGNQNGNKNGKPNGKQNGKGNNQGSTKGNRDMDADICRLVTARVDENDTSARYKTYSAALEWYNLFLRVFKLDRLESLQKTAQTAFPPMNAISLVNDAAILVKAMEKKRDDLEKEVNALKLLQEISKDVFSGCTELRTVLAQDDYAQHRSLFENKNLCYRVQPLHHILMANHDLLRRQAYTHLVKNQGMINPDVAPIFRRLEFSYNSTKFYATYGGVDETVVVFRITKTGTSADTAISVDDHVIKSTDISEPTVLLIDGTEDEVQRVLFDSSTITRSRPSTIKTRSRLFS
jgi:hypothetical protein